MKAYRYLILIVLMPLLAWAGTTTLRQVDYIQNSGGGPELAIPSSGAWLVSQGAIFPMDGQVLAFNGTASQWEPAQNTWNSNIAHGISSYFGDGANVPNSAVVFTGNIAPDNYVASADNVSAQPSHINLLAGSYTGTDAGADKPGADVNIIAGASHQTGATLGQNNSGNANIYGGSAPGSGDGGQVTLNGGNASHGGNGNGGPIVITAGSPAGTGLAGPITLSSGYLVQIGSPVMVLPTAASDPASASQGWFYYNTATENLRLHNATSWVDIGSSPWTIAGSTIYNNTVNVGIGTATPQQKLDILGNSQIIGHGSFGSNATINTSNLLYPGLTFSVPVMIDEEINSVAVNQISGITNFITYNPTGSATAVGVYGIDNEINIPAANSQTIGSINAQYSAINHYGSGNITGQLAGFFGAAYNQGSGNVAAEFGIYSDTGVNGSGNVTDAYSSYVRLYNGGGGGVVTNGYGVYIDTISATNSYGIYQADAANKNLFNGEMHLANHVVTSGTTPTIVTCGIGGTVVGNDTAGRITAGSGLLGSCIMTFAAAFANAPICVVQDETTLAVLRPSTTTTSLTISATSLTGDKLVYHCVGYE